MLNKLNLSARCVDDVFENLNCEQYESFFEMYNILPNVPKVHEILGDIEIIVTGDNWLIVNMVPVQIYESLEKNDLFPLMSYDEVIDNYRK